MVATVPLTSNAISTVNAMQPKGGSKLYPVTLDFTSAGELLVDFTLPYREERITAVQTLQVRNTGNPNPLTVHVVGTNRTIDVPAGANLTTSVPAPNLAKFLFTTISGVIVEADFYNVPLPESIVYPGSGGIPISGTISVEPAPLTVSGPAAFTIATANTAITVFPADAAGYGGFVTNPTGAASSAFIDLVNTPAAAAPGSNGTTFELAAGQTFTIPDGTTNATMVNSATKNATVSAVKWTR